MTYHVQWPDAEHHEIVPGLHMGGHLWAEDGRHRDSRHSTVSTDPSWDYVVSAYRSDHEESWPKCDQRLVIFQDTEIGLDEETWTKIKSAVDEVVRRWHEGQKVLIRCQAGYNRSGLMTSLVLMRLGYTADKAIFTLRWKRGRDVLTNRVFERYVHELEEEYFAPTDKEVSEDSGGKDQ